MKKLEDASKEVHEGIDAFEQTLKSQGINPRVPKDVANQAVTQTLNGGNDLSPNKSLASKTAASMSITRPGKNGLGASL